MAGAAAATSTLVVGQIEGETALLTTEAPELLVCRLPLALLPAGIAVGAPLRQCHKRNDAALSCFPQVHTCASSLSPTGHVIELNATRNTDAEDKRDREILDVQAQLFARLGPPPSSLPAATHSAEEKPGFGGSLVS